MSELISIIIPIYKVENYLKRCIDSVVHQTYQNLEIILVNDGSPDGCGKICDEYAEADQRIKVIHKENGGLSDARNAGIEIATGNDLCFIDSDDWVDCHYVEILYMVMVRRNADISFCHFLETDTETICKQKKPIKIFEYSNMEALGIIDAVPLMAASVPLVTAWGKMYKAFLFKEIRYPVGKKHEDEYLAHRVLFQAKKIVRITEPLYYYWQRPDSITGSFHIENRLDAIQALQDRVSFYQSISLSENEDEFRGLINQVYRHIIQMYSGIFRNRHLIKDTDMEKYYVNNYKYYIILLNRGGCLEKIVDRIYFLSPSILTRILNRIIIMSRKIRKKE